MTWLAAYCMVATCVALWLVKHMLEVDREAPAATLIAAVIAAGLWPLTALTTVTVVIVIAAHEKATRPSRAASGDEGVS